MKQQTLLEEPTPNDPRTTPGKRLCQPNYEPKGSVISWDDTRIPECGDAMTIVRLGGATRKVWFVNAKRGRVQLDLGPLNGCVNASLRSGELAEMNKLWQLERSAMLACRRAVRK